MSFDGSSYAEVLVPLPIAGAFTYRVPYELEGDVRPGHRVIVPFGQKKFYTGIVMSLTAIKPDVNFEIKPIAAALDKEPILRRPQLQLWQWISEYYLCAPGDVLRAALPAGLKVESETFLEVNGDYEPDPHSPLTEREAVIYQTLDHAGKRMSVAEIERATGLGNVSATATRMLDKGAVIISEKLVERYTARKVTYVRLTARRPDHEEALHKAFDAVSRSAKQQQALLALVDMTGVMRRDGAELREVTQAELLERTGLMQPVVKALADKGIVEIYRKEINRFRYNGLPTGTLPELSEAQRTALECVHRSWLQKEVTLLHGVTSSGKTEIYIHLIDFVLRRKRQVLYLVPEIALTTQLTHRLQQVFGEKVVIYHSKFSDNERVDIYRKILSTREPMVVIGARSALFLPFADLGLVIVDEEHETSYKQQDPAPRYNGRDTAIVLARMHGAKTLLGSATPAVDTYYKALEGRYGLVTLSERYGGVSLPDTELVNINAARRQGGMKGSLAPATAALVNEAVSSGRQAILFLNRRGYAPVATCRMCAYTPRCEHCDVALTYHKGIDRLVCHYCGATYPRPVTCPACHEPAMEIHGYGTERIEDEIEGAFGDTKVLRMDLDTTRNKDGYEHIINEFSAGKAGILVGTQMVTKGLDFGRVSVVGILNADAIINQPDFRASERAFNMMSQVAGRAGRRDVKGLVAIQTRQPDHPLFAYVRAHDYRGYYDEEIEERRKYMYPPFSRLIYIYIKHRERAMAEELAIAYGRRLRQLFGNRVLGPEEPTVGRVQTFYIRKLMLKIETAASMKRVKEIMRQTLEEMHASGMQAAKGAIVYYDVDPY